LVEAANKINFDVNDSQGRTAELQRQAGRWEIHDSSEHWSSPTRVALAQRIDHELLLYIRSSSTLSGHYWQFFREVTNISATAAAADASPSPAWDAGVGGGGGGGGWARWPVNILSDR